MWRLYPTWITTRYTSFERVHFPVRHFCHLLVSTHSVWETICDAYLDLDQNTPIPQSGTSHGGLRNFGSEYPPPFQNWNFLMLDLETLVQNTPPPSKD